MGASGGEASSRLDDSHTEPNDVLLICVPVTPPVSLEERRDHVAERVRVRLEEALLHGLVLDERVVRVLVDEVVDFSRSGAPAHRVPETLGDFSRPFIPRSEHALVELGV